MDAEELQKRNTDCVYFLASPLTCKKGMECEYRHSEIARLNPKDCYYWLAGSCLYPGCAFRHPPLEGRTEALSQSADPQTCVTLPVNKTNVPCYFYFNGFCNKGDRCSFMHGHDAEIHAWKSSKAASSVNDPVPLEKKVSIGSDTGSTPMMTHPNPSETAPNEIAYKQTKPKQDSHQSAPGEQRSDSPHISETQGGESVVRSESDSLLPAEGFVQSGSLACTDQSSDEQVGGFVEREEWLESSPGFDVLVEDKSENLGYEDDADYLPVLEEEDRELNVQFMAYDYEKPIEYDSAYLESGDPYEQKTYDAYNRLDNGKACDYVSKVAEESRESIFYRISAPKRNFSQMEPIFDGQRGMDLRYHLKKRRVVDDDYRVHFSRRHDSSRLFGRIKGSPQWHGSRGENGILQRGRFREAHINMPRWQFREKRHGKQQAHISSSRSHFQSSEVSRKPALKKGRSSEESTMFTAPKTLDQIKEEKMKAQNYGDFSGPMRSFSRTASENFQGPKPLNEILKDKRRLGSVVNRYDDNS